MKEQNYLYLGDASIRVDNTTLRPWPDFTVIGATSRQEADRIVCDLLDSDDPLAVLWRAKIPEPVLEMVRGFPHCLWRSLLEVSQLHPGYFVQWGKSCPALIALLAVHDVENQTDSDIDRVRAFYRGRKERMRILGLPPTKEAYHILSKVPIDDCYPVQLEQLREAVNDRSHRRLLRHLNEITTETLDTLLLPVEYLDVNLLNLRRSDQMPAQCGSVAELVREIVHFRRVRNKLPLWPYRGENISLQHLIHARNSLEVQLALGEDCNVVRFPEPPLEGFKSSKLEIEPLTSVRALFQEGKEMGNCIMTYARSVLDGKRFAYRMLHPCRATILLVKNPDHWYPVEIRTFENKYAPSDAIDLVFKWTGATPSGWEVDDDFPF